MWDAAEVAALAARAGGHIVRAGAGRKHTSAQEKGAGDYVTEVDLASEAAIRELLGRATPDIPVVGEEGGGDEGSDGSYWLTDPLDGTTNFIHGFPAVGVSVALVRGGRAVAGAIDAPFLGRTWVGARGAGAVRRDADGSEIALHVSERPVSQAVVGTGFPFRHRELVPRYLEAFHGAFGRFEDLRRPGAAALDLAWVADGTFDGFFELSLGAWDVAAGAVLIQEAGGVVTDWSGGPGFLDGDILAGSAGVHAALLEVVGA